MTAAVVQSREKKPRTQVLVVNMARGSKRRWSDLSEKQRAGVVAAGVVQVALSCWQLSRTCGTVLTNRSTEARECGPQCHSSTSSDRLRTSPSGASAYRVLTRRAAEGEGQGGRETGWDGARPLTTGARLARSSRSAHHVSLLLARTEQLDGSIGPTSGTALYVAASTAAALRLSWSPLSSPIWVNSSYRAWGRRLSCGRRELSPHRHGFGCAPSCAHGPDACGA